MNRKIIKVTIVINGVKTEYTTEKGLNQLSTTGLRVTSSIISGNGSMTPTAQIKIYNLKMETMLDLMRIRWQSMTALMSTIKLEVGEEGKTLAIAYEGNITFAHIDMNGAPDVALVIDSQVGALDSLKSVPSICFTKPTDAAGIVETICLGLGYVFENNAGASKILNPATYENPNIHKVEQICHDCDFDLYVEHKLIAITPRGVSRQLAVPVITPNTGLIGYPSPDQRGVKFKCFYDPLIRFGGLIKLDESELTTCNGEWRIYGLTILLDSNVANGNWFCEVNAAWKEPNDAAIKSK